MSTAALETRVELNRTRLETLLKVLDVDGAVRRVRGGWEATGRDWAYDEERYRRVAEAREREQQAMLDYLATDACRMRFLREQLDDPGAEDCGRCDNCGGLALSTEISVAAVEEAQVRLARPGVVVEPRKMWPTGLASLGLQLKGRISGARGGPGHRPAHRPRPRQRAARPVPRGHPGRPGPGPAGAGDGRGARRLAAGGRRDRGRRVRAARHPGRRPGRRAGPLPRGVRSSAGSRSPTPRFLPARGRSTRRTASRRSIAGSRCEPTMLSGRRVLLVDDLVVTGWTLTLAATPAARGGRRRACCPWCWPPPPDLS